MSEDSAGDVHHATTVRARLSAVLQHGTISAAEILDYDRTLEELRKHAVDPTPLMLTLRPRGEIREWSLWTACMLELFERVSTMRVVVLADGIVQAVEQLHPMQLALTGRALIESAAALVYEQRRVFRLMETALGSWCANEQSALALEKLNLSGRFDWERYYTLDHTVRRAYVKSFGSTSASSPEHVAPNVLTMLDALRDEIAQHSPERVGELHCAYAYLSDICHPSVGGRLLFMRDNDGRIGLSLDASGDATRRVIKDMFPAFVEALAISSRCIERLAGRRRQLVESAPPLA